MENLVLLTGRGGSGTRLLRDFASSANIFMGNKLNESGDSVEWVKLVYDLVELAGGGNELPSGSQYRTTIRAKAREILGNRQFNHDQPWGIKLPELMLVLPLFIDAFPTAKVIHLIRDPVSLSLRRSHMTSRMDNRVGRVTLPAAYVYGRRSTDMLEKDQVYLHNAYAWLYQVDRVANYGRDQLNTLQYLELKYEHICDSPEDVLQLFLHFLELDKQVDQQIHIDKERAASWSQDNQQAREVRNLCGSVAERLGYRPCHLLQVD